MTVADTDFLRASASNVLGTTKGGSGNPSPITAEGVFLGIKAALSHRRGTPDLSGIRVAVQGLGSVGSALCERLAREGATLIVHDIDLSRMERVAKAFGAECVPAEKTIAAEADVFAPCALGGVISRETIPLLKAEIVAGSANNQLARHEDARLLMERGILYAPDYVINSGGLINVAAELSPDGYRREAVMAKVAQIPAILSDIFERARAQQKPTNDIAAEIAMERIHAAR